MESNLTPCVIAQSFADIGKCLTPDGRPLVVNHFATWCDPCMDEMPVLAAAAEKYAGRVRFLGVSWDRFTDDDEPAEIAKAVDAVCQQVPVRYPVILAPADPEGLFRFLKLDARTIPQTFVLDGAGVKLWSHAAALEGDSADEFARAIEAALAGKRP